MNDRIDERSELFRRLYDYFTTDAACSIKSAEDMARLIEQSEWFRCKTEHDPRNQQDIARISITISGGELAMLIK
jgi:hypothetical protein